jgi:hypothetical protein
LMAHIDRVLVAMTSFVLLFVGSRWSQSEASCGRSGSRLTYAWRVLTIDGSCV